MYFLGIETGGTRSHGVLTDLSGTTFRVKKGRPGNISVLGVELWKLHFADLVTSLLEDKKPGQITWATLGVAGAGRSAQRKRVREVVREFGIDNVTILTDAELLHYSIHGSRPGLVLNAGTGAICVIRQSDGSYRQFGGWGYLLGDEGSGYDLGRKAVRFALAETEAKIALSDLSQTLLRFYDLTEATELVTAIFSYGNPQEIVSSSAKVVCECALRGEPNAMKFVDESAESLLQLYSRSAKHLDATGAHRLALFGSLLSLGSPVRTALQKKMPPDLVFVEAESLPVAASVLLSVLASGCEPEAALLEKLKTIGSG